MIFYQNFEKIWIFLWSWVEVLKDSPEGFKKNNVFFSRPKHLSFYLWVWVKVSSLPAHQEVDPGGHLPQYFTVLLLRGDNYCHFSMIITLAAVQGPQQELGVERRSGRTLPLRVSHRA